MKISLNGGNWRYRCDAEQQGEHENWHDPVFIKKNWDTFPSIELPCCWNSIIEDEILPYDRYVGYFWFFHQFTLDKIEDKDYFINFNGVNYYCKIWINGTYLGDHQGGFLPFKLKIPNKILEKNNVIAVEVENFREFSRLPSLQYDWYNWGGIYRDIDLIVVPKEWIQWIRITTKKITPNSATLIINYKLTIKGQIKWKILQDSNAILEGTTEAQEKKGEFGLSMSNPKLWSPESPTLYEFQAQFNEEEELFKIRFGIRTIEVGKSGILINNKLIKIKGVSLHEEFVPYGRAIKAEDRLNDLKNMKKFGFNTLRTAHYSHDEKLIELADEVGILILEEIPVYWYCDFKNPDVLKLALTMVKDLIYRDFNHPSVILWSMGNEIPIEHRVCSRFIHQLMQYARKLDSSRIVTYVSSRMVSDTFRRKSDLPCVNLYFGWYLFSERNLNMVIDFIHQTAPAQPLLITEFGAGAKFGFHSKEYVKFSEEKQVSILTHSIETFNSKDYIAGWIIWIYRDFRSPMRTNKYQKGFNRKGVVSEKNEPKLITKVIKKVLWKIPKKRKAGFLARFYFIFKPVELMIFGILFGFFQNLFLKGQFERYYSRKPFKSG
ncbi:MAG: beta galactosidase jelly roll domain-containing protein [Candidatus Helarchaeota archaeon]|nr:beta galactosidase jelly roll domain-containing protein [Candidatus Helarchaeota archaeon]